MRSRSFLPLGIIVATIALGAYGVYLGELWAERTAAREKHIKLDDFAADLTSATTMAASRFATWMRSSEDGDLGAIEPGARLVDRAHLSPAAQAHFNGSAARSKVFLDEKDILWESSKEPARFVAVPRRTALELVLPGFIDGRWRLEGGRDAGPFWPLDGRDSVVRISPAARARIDLSERKFYLARTFLSGLVAAIVITLVTIVTLLRTRR